MPLQQPLLETSALGLTPSFRCLLISQSCPVLPFYYLYNIWRIRKYLSRWCTKTLVHAFITARIDYCNSILYGLPDYCINKLQRIQNAAARLICQQSRFCHITPVLFDLHWLPVKFHIEFKILLITFKALEGLAPSYIDSLISIKSTPQYDLRSSNDSLLLSYPKPLSKAVIQGNTGWSLFYICCPKTLERSSFGHQICEHCYWF